MRLKTSYLTGLLLLLAFLFADFSAHAQFGLLHRKRKPGDTTKRMVIYDIDTLQAMVPRQRQVFYDKVLSEIRKADYSDGAGDNFIYVSDDSTVNQMFTKAMLTDVRHLLIMIENLPATGDPMVSNNEKQHCLNAVYDMMSKFNKDTRQDPYFYRKLVTNMHDMIIALHENRLMDFAQRNINKMTLMNGERMFDGYPDVKSYVYTEMAKLEPKLMIQKLSDFANEPYADSVVKAAARVVPNEVFNFASSTNFKLRTAVRRSTDPLVQTIVKIADESAVPLKAMPFLTDVYSGKYKIKQIDSIAANEDAYFQNLVRLKLSGDTLGSATYTDELAYRGLSYVRKMNDLHEEKDAVRFRCIDGFSPESLYCLLVYGQDEIYTSSFLGTFNRMMQRMAPMKGNELLARVNRDHFRTFLRMCAGYNTLMIFLGTIDEGNRSALMTDFIAGLDKGKEDDLEGAVDVADAFGSINDDKLSLFLEEKVRDNYERSYRERSRKGMIIYGLLATLFDGVKAASNDTQAIRESERLGLPPINLVPYRNMLSDSGIVYEQFFFYGDEDGRASFNSFKGNFADGKWKYTGEKYWCTYTSTQGKKIVVYANLPLSEPEDEEAQKQLCAHLENNNIHPTLIVHRGHSYHLPLTLDRLSKQNKIVVLGSCGGYHNLATILQHAPDAHIISSKQTGMMVINEPIIKAINTELLAGRDINWINMWGGLETYFKNKKAINEKFSDYVPPYKNLGAIFIKSYRKLSSDEETERLD